LKAAEQGDPGAQANLGALYKAGIGVPRDWIQAYKWYKLSHQDGAIDRRRLLSELAAAMSHSDVAEAERMANVWQQTHNERQAPRLYSILEEGREKDHCLDCLLISDLP